MFTKKEHLLFLVSLILIITGYSCMAIDPEDNGFGMLTLWVAPPLLLMGFAMPIAGIMGLHHLSACFSAAKLSVYKWKHVVGLLVLGISFLTYLLSLEPTASLWDCSEFIASAFKLQVPHTPGTPLSLLVGRMFTVLSFGDVTRVAWSINVMSAFFSALTAWIVYHIIYDFSTKLIGSRENSILQILGSSCGSLCLTFSDTFWFSAVEAETYGIACFFLLLMVRLILSGKDLGEPWRSRRLILIFYIAGLAYCIHPMCLLSLAILPFSWFAHKPTLTNILYTSLAGLFIVLLINRLVAVGLFELAFSFDLFVVNKIALPFYSGAYLLVALLIIIFFILLKRFKRASPYTWSVVFLLLGFTPYLMLFIRSNHNPPIDETNPENLSMIKAYMNRESYPASPLLYGPYFDAQIHKVTVKKTIYVKGADHYEVAGTMPAYHYENSRHTILPRLYSNDANHIQSYRTWTGLKENEKPRFTDNLRFMFSYQLGHMYGRYLMWNFAGRESDRQDSRWLSPVDGMSLAGSDENKARNQYWMLPFALGLLGLLYQYKKDRKGFYTNSIFFLVTGIVLALYLNSTPNEPRERDYIYVGSYIAYSVWIGLGIIALYNFTSGKQWAFLFAAVISIGIPGWMLHQNFDDHNRAGRTFQIDNARSILNSCAPNSILFTGGDNDTFPLWYLQEVEGYRTDVRVVVLSYFNADWYINQLRKAYYKSKPFALTLEPKNYRQYGVNDVLYVHETIKGGIDIQKFLHLLKVEHPGLTVRANTGEPYNIVPSKTLKLKIDAKNVSQENLFSSLSGNNGESTELTLRITGNYLQKNALAFLDLVASNAWQRPVYFNFTSLNAVGLEIMPYVIREGNVYRLTPTDNGSNEIKVDTALSYRNLVEDADYSNLADERIYFNYEDYHARMITPVRESFNALAIAFLREGNTPMASKVILYALEHLYPPHLTPSYTNVQAAEILLSLDKIDLARSLCISLFDFHHAQVQADLKRGESVDRLDYYLLRESAEILSGIGEPEYVERIGNLKISGNANP